MHQIILQQNETFVYFKDQANEYRVKYTELMNKYLKLQNDYRLEVQIIKDEQEKEFKRRVDLLDQASCNKFYNQELIIKERDAELCRMEGEQALLSDRLKKVEDDLFECRSDLTEANL